MLHAIDLASALLDPEMQGEALRVQAKRELANGAARAAFKFADRLCRITGSTDARALLLRSDIAAQLGNTAAALDDLAKAFALDPIDSAVLRAMLDRSSESDIGRLARLVFDNPYADREAQNAALRAAERAGYGAIAKLVARPERVCGWVAWRGGEKTFLRFGGRPSLDIGLRVDGMRPAARQHWTFSDVDCVVPSLSRDAMRRVFGSLQVEIDGRNSRHLALDGFAAPRRMRQEPRRPPAARADAGVSVVVPLHGDPRATQLCLLALARQRLRDASIRVVLVQDNPNFSRMSAIAERASKQFGFEVIVNAETIGYAASVNHALDRIESGDVLLLNADAVLPLGAVERLRATATGAPDIATVTPFSNNGEEASFPSPFHANAMGSYREVCVLDAVAARVNEGREVTLVNGIGFCLYVTRRALDAVGFLPERYERGYYEDVDFCLAAKAAGLRNVCATNVYVGHKGASSFQGEKRALVVRNRRVLQSHHRTYATDSLALLKADPLREARARLEAAVVPSRGGSVLIVVAPDESPSAQAARQAELPDAKLQLSWTHEAPTELSLRARDGTIPQSLSFHAMDQAGDLASYLVAAGVKRVHLAGPCLHLTPMLDRVAAAGLAVDIAVDGSFLRVPFQHPAECDGFVTARACQPCTERFDAARMAAAGRQSGTSIGARLKGPHRIQPTNAMADAVTRHLGLSQAERSGAYAPVASPADADIAAGRTLGILGDVRDGPTMRLLHRLFRAPDGREGSMVLFGSSLDDLRLMSSGRAFVTGPVEAGDLDDLLRCYEIGALFAPSRWSGFGDLERHGGGRPLAYFDWAGGSMPKRDGDLALDPRICDAKAVHQLIAWWKDPQDGGLAA